MAKLLKDTNGLKRMISQMYNKKWLKAEAKGIRKNYQTNMKKLKKDYFRKSVLIYLDLCNYCSEEVKLFPELCDKGKFQKEFSKIYSKTKNDFEIVEFIIEYIIDNHENFDEFLNELFSEIERLNNKATKK